MRATLNADRGDFLAIVVTGREHPDALDYWDGNWLISQVHVKAGSFRGDFFASLRAEDIVRLRDEAARCALDARGTFAFETMEEQLSVSAESDTLGHFAAIGIAKDAAGWGNELRFRLELDQTYLPSFVAELTAMVDAYPVVGKP